VARKYRKKIGGRSYKNYSDDILEEALNKIANGEISILAASKAYKISYGTLHNKFNGKHVKKCGHPTILFIFIIYILYFIVIVIILFLLPTWLPNKILMELKEMCSFELIGIFV
jgi:hypothetical protein